MLSDQFGPNWTQTEDAGLGSAWSEALTAKAKEDQAVRAPNVVYDVPLAYAEFRDLGELLTKHRRLFEPIFRDWQITMAHFRAAEKLRNTIQHNRDISPTQQSLLVGIAGEIQDSVNIWRIGTPLRTKRTVLQFQDEIAVQDKTDTELLEEAAAYVREWRGRILDAVQGSSLDPDRFGTIEDEQLKYSIRVQHIEASIWTQPAWIPTNQSGRTSYISFQAEFKYKPAFRYPDRFLEAIGKPYHVIIYELEHQLDVAALKRWSAERAGLDPSSSTSGYFEVDSIYYSWSLNRDWYRGHFRIGAQALVDGTGEGGGRLLAQLDPPAEHWHAHELLGPEQLIGFMVGDIAPKAMMHLVRMSLRPRF